jgi:ketosteroid isomerase-like protein
MSSANLDLVRSLYAAWGRGDFFSPADWAHPEVEHVIADGPTPTSRTGLLAVAQGMREFLSTWEDFRIAVDEYRELDEGCVLVLVRFSGRGKTSGVEIGQVQAEAANLLHVRSGKVTRLVFYWDREHALADLGLAPEGDAADRCD